MDNTSKTFPVIGVFDSGVGGLTVLRELLVLFPNADFLYFGDTTRLPYGSKSAQTVAKYAIGAAHFLEQRGAGLLVIACNTATALALEELKAAVKVPVIGVVEPGAHAAASISKSRHAVVLATEATIASHAYQRSLKSLGLDSIEKACPLFVPLVEEGWAEHHVTRDVAKIYLSEAFDGTKGTNSPDVLLLGCTHYPLLRPVLEQLAPPNVHIVDSAASTAHAVVKALGATTPPSSPGSVKFFATDSAEKFRGLGERFLGRKITDVQHVDLEM